MAATIHQKPAKALREPATGGRKPEGPWRRGPRVSRPSRMEKKRENPAVT